MPSGLDCQHQLGADTIGRGDQDGIAKPGRAGIEQTGEGADAAHDPGAAGAGRQGLVGVDRLGAGRRVHARVLVGVTFDGVLAGLYIQVTGHEADHGGKMNG